MTLRPASMPLFLAVLALSPIAAQVPPSLYPPPVMVAGTIPVGTNPTVVAVNIATHSVYVANQVDETLTVIDGVALKAIATVPIGVPPYALAVNPVTNRIYVANGNSGSLMVIDGSKNSVIATVDLQPQPNAVVVDSVLNNIYVTSFSGWVTMISGKDNTVTSIIQVDDHPDALALNYRNHKLYVASYDLGSVTVLSAKTGVEIGHVKKLGGQLTALAVDPNADCAYVVSQTAHTVTRINGANSYATFTYTGFTLPAALAFDPGESVIYIGDGGVNQIAMVASGNNTISRSNLPVLTADALALDSIAAQLDMASHNGYAMVFDNALDPIIFIYNEFPAGQDPYAIAVDPVTHRSFVTNYLDNSVTVLDGAPHTLTTTPNNVPMQATALDVDPVTNTLYIVSPVYQTVNAVSENQFDAQGLVTATVPVGLEPGNAAVNPVTNRIYVPNAGSGTISIIDGATDAVSQVSGLPQFAAPTWAVVDSASNRVFVGDFVKAAIYVIDGSSGAVLTSVPAPGADGGLAINPIAGKVYATCPHANSLEVLDEFTGQTVTIAVRGILAVAVNTTTNQIFAAGTNAVTVIDGGTNVITATITPSLAPTAIGVNPVNNKIYVLASANDASGHVFVYDGVSYALLADVSVGSGPAAIGFNPLSNLAYVASSRANYLTVIDGATEATEFLYTDGSHAPNTGGSVAVAFDPVLDMVTAAGQGEVTSSRQSAVFSPSTTVPAQGQAQILVQITPVSDAHTIATTPLFRTGATPVSFNIVAETYGHSIGAPEQIYYQIDGWQGPWKRASMTSAPGVRPAAGTVTTPILVRGLHYLYVWAGTPDVSTVQANAFNQNSSVASPVAAVIFSVEPAAVAAAVGAAAGSNQTALLGQPFGSALTALVTDSSNQPVAGVSVTFSAPAPGSSATFAGLASATAVTNSSGLAVSPVPVANLTLGSYAVVATATGVGAPAHFDLSNANPGPPTVSLSQTSVNFGAAVVGSSSAARSVKLTNSGTGPLSIASIAVSGDYTQTNTCPATLNPSASCVITLTFAPQAAGAVSGILTMADNAANAPQLVTLSGTGLNALTIKPSSLAFGGVTVGTASAPQTLTLTNNTAAAVTISLAASAGYFAAGSGASPCGTSLASKASCTVAVTFAPSQNGTLNGSVSAVSPAWPGAITLLSGTGTGGAPATLSFSPASLTFPAQVLGIASAARNVAITNTGGVAAAITPLLGSADFFAAPGGSKPCGGTLAAHATCSIAITFTPAGAGSVSGSVAVAGGAFCSTSGTGVPAVSVSPASLTFGPQNVATSSSPQTLSLTNHQTAALTITSVTASGDYSVSAGGATPCAGSVPAQSSCTLQVTFSPTATGTIAGVVTIVQSAAGSPAIVVLSGTGN